jgi:hypothetical protein
MAETDVILTPDQRVRVFISSTLEELAAAFNRSPAMTVSRRSGSTPEPVVLRC